MIRAIGIVQANFAHVIAGRGRGPAIQLMCDMDRFHAKKQVNKYDKRRFPR